MRLDLLARGAVERHVHGDQAGRGGVGRAPGRRRGNRIERGGLRRLRRRPLVRRWRRLGHRLGRRLRHGLGRRLGDRGRLGLGHGDWAGLDLGRAGRRAGARRAELGLQLVERRADGVQPALALVLGPERMRSASRSASRIICAARSSASATICRTRSATSSAIRSASMGPEYLGAGGAGPLWPDPGKRLPRLDQLVALELRLALAAGLDRRTDQHLSAFESFLTNRGRTRSVTFLPFFAFTRRSIGNVIRAAFLPGFE